MKKEHVPKAVTELATPKLECWINIYSNNIEDVYHRGFVFYHGTREEADQRQREDVPRLRCVRMMEADDQ